MTPTPPSQRTSALLLRAECMDAILDRIEVDANDCWLWPGTKWRGYGVTSVAGRTRRVHHLTYLFFREPVPAGLVLDHLCRVPHCVNPWHLEAVTQRENVLRGEHPNMVAARTDTCIRGHSLIEHGRLRVNGRRQCRICSRSYPSRKRQKAAA